MWWISADEYLCMCFLFWECGINSFSLLQYVGMDEYRRKKAPTFHSGNSIFSVLWLLLSSFSFWTLFNSILKDSRVSRSQSHIIFFAIIAYSSSVACRFLKTIIELKCSVKPSLFNSKFNHDLAQHEQPAYCLVLQLEADHFKLIIVFTDNHLHLESTYYHWND